MDTTYAVDVSDKWGEKMRLIDADALRKKYTMVIKRYERGIMECPAVLLKDIDDAPTIEIPTWIPCSERLPKRQGHYICTCKDGSKYKRTTVVKWSNGWQLTGARAYWIVLAWMPLPKPWKGADDE